MIFSLKNCQLELRSHQSALMKRKYLKVKITIFTNSEIFYENISSYTESWKFLSTFSSLPLKHIFSASPFLSPFLTTKLWFGDKPIKPNVDMLITYTHHASLMFSLEFLFSSHQEYKNFF